MGGQSWGAGLLRHTSLRPGDPAKKYFLTENKNPRPGVSDSLWIESTIERLRANKGEEYTGDESQGFFTLPRIWLGLVSAKTPG